MSLRGKIARLAGVRRRPLGRGWQTNLGTAIVTGGLLLAIPLGLTALVLRLAIDASHKRHLASSLLSSTRDLNSRAALLERRVLLAHAVDSLSGKKLGPRFSAALAVRIDEVARDFSFDPWLVLAVVSVESRFDPFAIGRFRSGAASGALGLMQVKPGTAALMALAMGLPLDAPEDLFDPSFNIAVGTAYLVQMIHRFGSLRLGVMAYNVGPGALQQALRGEGQLPVAYWRRVLHSHGVLRARYDPGLDLDIRTRGP